MVSVGVAINDEPEVGVSVAIDVLVAVADRDRHYDAGCTSGSNKFGLCKRKSPSVPEFLLISSYQHMVCPLHADCQVAQLGEGFGVYPTILASPPCNPFAALPR